MTMVQIMTMLCRYSYSSMPLIYVCFLQGLEIKYYLKYLKVHHLYFPVEYAIPLRFSELQLTYPEEAAGLIKLVSRWWNIVNVKTPQKRRRLCDPWQDPISAMCCQQPESLDKFVTW